MNLLFKDKERTRTEPMQPGESEFTFYNSSARKPFAAYRELVNRWLADVPEPECSKMVQSFRSRSSSQYHATFVELEIFTALRKLGHIVDIHPKCPHPSNRPDFLVRNHDGQPLAFIEVTTFGPETEAIQREKREATIMERLQRVGLPSGWGIIYQVEEYGSASPATKKLATQVEEWAAVSCSSFDPENPPQRLFELDDWKLNLTLFAGFDEEKITKRRIVGENRGTRWIAPHVDIRDALEAKGQKYGILDTPFLIVVADCKGELSPRDGAAESGIAALFGAVQYRVWIDGDNIHHSEPGRAGDGYWGKPNAPRHRNVSGVLMMPKPDLWSMRDEQFEPVLIHNPFATSPLPNDLLPLSSYRYVESEDEFQKVDGAKLADVLQLPAEWPPQERSSAGF